VGRCATLHNKTQQLNLGSKRDDEHTPMVLDILVVRYGYFLIGSSTYRKGQTMITYEHIMAALVFTTGMVIFGGLIFAGWWGD
jgi:hypothetical protein